MLWSEQTIDQVYQVIGARIRARRTDLGLTQTELGQHVGLTRSSIANIEAGRQRAMIHTIMQLANQLDLEPAQLFPEVEHDNRMQNRLTERLEGQPESTYDFVRSVVHRASRH